MVHLKGRFMAVGGLVCLVLGMVGFTWMQMRPGDEPGTVTLGVQPLGVALDARTGRLFIANAGLDGSEHMLSVLDARTGKPVQTIPVGSGPGDVAVDEATGRLFVADEGHYDAGGLHDAGVSVVDTRSARVIRTVPVAGLPAHVMVDRVTGHAFVTIYRWGAKTPNVIELDGHTGAVVRNATGYSRWLTEDTAREHAFVANGKSIEMIDARTGRVLNSALVGSDPGPAVVDAATKRAFVAVRTTGQIAVFDTHSGALLRTIFVGPNPSYVVVDARSARVFVANFGPADFTGEPRGNGSVSILDARTGNVLKTISLDLYPGALAVDARLGRVYVTTAGPIGRDGSPTSRGHVYALDARTGHVLRIMRVGVAPFHMAVDERTGDLFVVNAMGYGGSYNGPSEWYLEWLPHHPPKGTVSMLDLSH